MVVHILGIQSRRADTYQKLSAQSSLLHVARGHQLCILVHKYIAHLRIFTALLYYRPVSIPFFFPPRIPSLSRLPTSLIGTYPQTEMQNVHSIAFLDNLQSNQEDSIHQPLARPTPMRTRRASDPHCSSVQYAYHTAPLNVHPIRATHATSSLPSSVAGYRLSPPPTVTRGK